MRNRFLFAALLIVVLVALIAVAAYQTLPQPDIAAISTQSADVRDTQLVFGNFDTSQMQALRVDDPTSEVDLILERDDDQTWRLVGLPESIFLDPVVTDNIAKTIAFMPYTELLGGVLPEEYVNFGLTNESIWLQIQVILKTGETYNIAVGGQIPTSESGYYALVEDREALYVLNRGAIEFLNGHLRLVQQAFA
jgi:hypothetical protein